MDDNSTVNQPCLSDCFSLQKFELSFELRLHRLMRIQCLVYNSEERLILESLGASKDTLNSTWDYKLVMSLRTPCANAKRSSSVHNI